MTPFLYNVAEAYYKAYGQDVSRCTFVFPNRRAGLFFQRYLSQIAGRPLFSPEILTIADFFTALSPYRLANRIEMLFILYDIYKAESGTSETFDEFIFWGEMLLNDFDDVDKYMVDARQLFRNISDLKEIDAGFSFLTEDQVMAIRRFWANFHPIGDSKQKKDFLEMWQVLYTLYSSLREALHERGMAYEGMIFRHVAERAREKEDIDLPSEKIVFVGLNAHSKTEEVVLRYLQQAGVADFYFDYSSPLVSDSHNRASLFVGKNKTMFPSQLTLEADEPPVGNPHVEVVGIPSAVGQSKHAGTILKTLVDAGAISSPNDALKTAVILPDENLLLPMLYSVPAGIDKINVTMGYGLHHSAVSGLMEHIFDLQRNIRNSNGKDGFYFRFVLPILGHRYVALLAGEQARLLRQNIVQYNKIIVTCDEFAVHPLLELIFTPIREWNAISFYLREILLRISAALASQIIDHEDEGSTTALDMEREFVIEYYKTLNKMNEALKNAPLPEMKPETYFRLLRKLAAGISIPFSGEPLSGLQIMGVLETRVLDFENLIILSMNEGVFPQRKAANSFIPYNLRQGFELPTYEHQDSVFAYHFYRMISRARNIYLLYDTRTDGLQTGEVSRYVNQLKYLYGNRFDIRERLAVYEVSSTASQPISMQKNGQVMQKLGRFLSGGDRSLSASSINMYLDCPLQFYFSVVEGIGQEDEVSEVVEASTFGSIFHSVMEWLYEPFRGKTVTADLLKLIAKNEKLLSETIERSFAENYFKTKDIRELTGQNFLTGEVVRRYVKQVLKTDMKLTPFVYLDAEERIKTEYHLALGKVVVLKGILDRVDEVNRNTRIIDYKTGKGSLRFKDMPQLFDKEAKERPKAVMQVFMYAHLYLTKHPDRTVEPGIYYLRNLFDDKFDADVVHKPNMKETHRVTDFAMYREEFKSCFDACLEEIFNPDIPFTQTQTGKPCQWCAFTNICKK
ncbi:hypothetical protein M2132_001316 [Dysgonomonas sp. PH5-45]|uniref:PD-(D/E)XK nuclease family protein n=1 Tax=unclassified Dysgonomonas TaxID=2630389 RepID=UPI0024740543|nr:MULTISPECIES: PD-(D/E)XK nuclease family protein [unclassified Dysgonomonas]MDH6354979.1 hypothetical protein [Dysgonomonas sp. PH5-45]MDH6387897.1 hypothetical protein [Dysgonomonas sp. PH5-37]